MNRILMLLFTVLVLGCGISCAGDEPAKTDNNTTATGYFGGKKLLIAYFSWGSTTQRMANQI